MRLPDSLREQLKKASEANERTLTAEVIYRLENSFLGPPGGLEGRLEQAQDEFDAIGEAVVEATNSPDTNGAELVALRAALRIAGKRMYLLRARLRQEQNRRP